MLNKLRILLWAALTITFVSGSVWAKTDQTKPQTALAKANADLVSAANQYRASVQALIPIYEDNLKTATESVEKRKALLAQGLISKRDLAAGEHAVKEAQAQLDQTRAQLTESDQLIAEAKAELVKPVSPSGTGHYTNRAAVMRYSGAGSWAITQASKVEGYFTSTFGRQLPVSAFGQSATHNRLGFDHHNSVDVALHPDSAEGKALINYLRSNGIPFLAFRSAVPGVATGAHIHIGYPSHRMS
ncbi:MAG: hypothetical protein WAV20_07150 [Blastocatellia bacterium]